MVLSLPAVVTTARLRLPVVTAQESDRILAGEWHPGFGIADPDGWGPRHVVRAFDGLVVGSIGFCGPPQDDETEVGYGLVREAWGHGVATEALTGLLSACPGVTVRAAVEPTNRAALRVLARCGFTDLRGADGEGRLVMARPLTR